jgi:hypothetical protein
MGVYAKIPWQSDDEYQWLDRLGTLDERLNRLPEAERVEYRRACLQGYINGHPLSGHDLSMPWAKTDVNALVSLNRARRLLDQMGV